MSCLAANIVVCRDLKPFRLDFDEKFIQTFPFSFVTNLHRVLPRFDGIFDHQLVFDISLFVACFVVGIVGNREVCYFNTQISSQNSLINFLYFNHFDIPPTSKLVPDRSRYGRSSQSEKSLLGSTLETQQLAQSC